MRQTNRIGKALIPCAAALITALWLLPVQAQGVPGDTGASAYEPRELAVPFQHNEHNKKAKITKCATCHHPLPGMRPVKGKKNASGTERRCADCHHERPAPTDRAASLMVVSHKLCQDCHKARKKGPVNCSGCHKANAQESQKSAGLMPADSLLPADGLLPTPKQQVAPATPAGNNTEAK
ncbi:MAG: hypothetical protein AUJ49_12735 [Desulfovibrionaceae bacterium CG1_02_65_16]|nr:MAG: hypothetical protein AUJ49_12735 [Desulfovibrionaceae bacterium CG1_02_65_16]